MALLDGCSTTIPSAFDQLPDPALEISQTIQDDTQSTIPDSQTRSSTRFWTRSTLLALWAQLDNRPRLDVIRVYRLSFFLCFRF